MGSWGMDEVWEWGVGGWVRCGNGELGDGGWGLCWYDTGVIIKTNG